MSLPENTVHSLPHNDGLPNSKPHRYLLPHVTFPHAATQSPPNSSTLGITDKSEHYRKSFPVHSLFWAEKLCLLGSNHKEPSNVHYSIYHTPLVFLADTFSTVIVDTVFTLTIAMAVTSSITNMHTRVWNHRLSPYRSGRWQSHLRSAVRNHSFAE